jgi:Cdc6-like AAA superfamily ATPase
MVSNEQPQVAEEDIMEKRLAVSQVFTPAAPMASRDFFAGRIRQISLVNDAVSQVGQHAVIYGERGVGKTSLVNVVAIFLRERALVMRVTCDSSDDFGSLWAKGFDEIVLTHQREALGFSTGDVGTDFPGSTLLRGSDDNGDHLTPADVRRALLTLGTYVELPVLVALDEVDRLQDPNVLRLLADTIKTLSDRADPVTLALVGVSDDVTGLIGEHESVGRALVQIEMPRMSTGELGEILDKGLAGLGMSISGAARRKITQMSQGLPQFTHSLGLWATRAALARKSLEVTDEDVAAATREVVDAADASLRASYEQAAYSSRPDNIFADVLLACALANADDRGYFSAAGVREQLRQLRDRAYEIASFARHLSEFSGGGSRAAIMEKSGDRRRYRYRFLDPRMKPYVVMKAYRDGRLTDESSGP